MAPILTAFAIMQYFICILVVCRITTVIGIPASIKPMDPTVAAGSDITLRCVLNTSATAQTAKDIVWYFKSYRHTIPRERYEVVDNISRLRLRNLTFADSGTYFCAFESDGFNLMQFQGTMLYVGVAPSPPTGLRCHSTNLLDFWCEWKDGVRNNIKTHYKFSYRPAYGRNDWRDCPKLDGRGSQTCMVPRNQNNGFSQLVRVTASNLLGSSTSEIRFNPETSTIPNPPTNVQIETLGPEELRISWALPKEWDDQMFASFLEYRLEISTDTGSKSRMIPDLNHGESYLQTRRYNVNNLTPHTTYRVWVSCRTLVSYGDEQWSDWSVVVSRLTAEAAPNAAVQDIQGQEYDNTVDPAYRRDVFLQWRDLPEENRRGVIHGYDVSLRLEQPDGSSDVVRSVRANGTMVLLQDFDKFRGYYVDIAACNSAGCGPIASYFLADKTSEPGAPENVRVQNASDTSVMITWQQPTRPNGFIEGYYVDWSKGLSEDANSFAEVNGSETSYTIQGVEPNKLYQFRVKARNSRGYSGWSNAPIQHTGTGSRMELLRTLIKVLHTLLVDMQEPGDDGNGNQVTLETISTFL
ncbi:cytokine receptor-like factor 1 [Asterias amurensis]|uniref:cytokine receptor-like factor 1 n=1 Tax=Asterias amurensis TaxID=7602 RepID=UPI003AB21F56